MFDDNDFDQAYQDLHVQDPKFGGVLKSPAPAPAAPPEDDEFDKLYKAQSDPKAAVDYYSQKYNVDPAFAHRIAQQESGYNQKSVSPKGARGVMQLMPETAKGLGVNPDNMSENVEGGVKYLRQLLDKHNGDQRLAAADYNSGAVDKYGGVPPFKETQQYVAKTAGDDDFDKTYQQMKSAPDDEFDKAYEDVKLGVKSSALTPEELAAREPWRQDKLLGARSSAQAMPGSLIHSAVIPQTTPAQRVVQASVAKDTDQYEVGGVSQRTPLNVLYSTPEEFRQNLYAKLGLQGVAAAFKERGGELIPFQDDSTGKPITDEQVLAGGQQFQSASVGGKNKYSVDVGISPYVQRLGNLFLTTFQQGKAAGLDDAAAKQKAFDVYGTAKDELDRVSKLPHISGKELKEQVDKIIPTIPLTGTGLGYKPSVETAGAGLAGISGAAQSNLELAHGLGLTTNKDEAALKVLNDVQQSPEFQEYTKKSSTYQNVVAAVPSLATDLPRLAAEAAVVGPYAFNVDAALHNLHKPLSEQLTAQAKASVYAMIPLMKVPGGALAPAAQKALQLGFEGGAFAGTAGLESAQSGQRPSQIYGQMATMGLLPVVMSTMHGIDAPPEVQAKMVDYLRDGQNSAELQRAILDYVQNPTAETSDLIDQHLGKIGLDPKQSQEFLNNLRKPQESASTTPVTGTEEAGKAVPTPESLQPPSRTGFVEAMQSAKGAVSDTFVRDAWDRLSGGKRLLFSDKPGTLENKIQAAFDSGEIKSPDDIRAIKDQHFTPQVVSTPARTDVTASDEQSTRQTAAPPPEPVESSNAASVKAFITKADEAALKARGYSDDDIYKMKPADAQKILEAPETAKPAEEFGASNKKFTKSGVDSALELIRQKQLERQKASEPTPEAPEPQKGPAVLRKPGDERGATISPSAQRPGQIQVTKFDSRGFSGDEHFKSYDEAHQEMNRRGFTESMPGDEFGKLVGSEKFAAGNELTDLINTTPKNQAEREKINARIDELQRIMTGKPKAEQPPIKAADVKFEEPAKPESASVIEPPATKIPEGSTVRKIKTTEKPVAKTEAPKTATESAKPPAVEKPVTKSPKPRKAKAAEPAPSKSPDAMTTAEYDEYYLRETPKQMLAEAEAKIKPVKADNERMRREIEKEPDNPANTRKEIQIRSNEDKIANIEYVSKLPVKRPSESMTLEQKAARDAKAQRIAEGKPPEITYSPVPKDDAGRPKKNNSVKVLADDKPSGITINRRDSTVGSFEVKDGQETIGRDLTYEAAQRVAESNIRKSYAGDKEPQVIAPTDAEAKAVSDGPSKIDQKTGLTKPQAQYLADKMNELADKGVPLGGATVKVPEDGEFTVHTESQAERLADKVEPAPAKTATEKSGFGKKNTVFTEEKADAGLDLLKHPDPNKLRSGPIGDEEFKAMLNVAGFYVEGGVRAFADFSREMVTAIGEQVKPYLRELFEQAHKEIGEEPPTQVGIKNAVTDAERQQLGQPPVDTSSQKRSFQGVIDAGKEAVDSGKIPANLADQIAAKPRPLTPEETAGLLYQKTQLLNHEDAIMKELREHRASGDIDAEVDARARLQTVQEALDTARVASRKSGYEQGLGLAIRRAMMERDYSLSRLTDRAEAANGGKPLSDAQKVDLEKLRDTIMKREEAYQEYDERKSKGEASKTVTELRKEATAERKAGRTQKRSNLDGEFASQKNALAKLFSRDPNGPGKGLGGSQAGAIDPELLGLPVEALKILRDMARNRLEAGLTTVDGVVDSIHEAVADVMGGVTKRQIRDLISGYGKTSKPNPEALAVAMRELTAGMRDVSAEEDILGGKAPERSGYQRGPMSPEARARRQRINQLMREHGIEIERSGRSPEEQQKSALDGVKTRLKNAIQDLQRQIDTGEKPAKRTSVPLDEEAKALKAKRDDLARDLQDINGPRKMTAEQRLEMAKGAAQKAIDEYQRRIDQKDFAAKQKGTTVADPELDALKAKRDALKEDYQKLADADPGVQGTRDAAKLAQLKTRMQKRYDSLKQQVDTGKFYQNAQGKLVTSKPRVPFAGLDPEGVALKAKVAEAQQAADAKIKAIELANRSVPEKIMDGLAKIRRFIVLSGATGTEKLTMAGVLRQVSDPIESGIGAGVNKIPGISKIAAAAPREGAFKPSVEAQASALYIKKMMDLSRFRDTLSKGKGRLDLLHGGKEYFDSDSKTDRVLGFFNRLHATLKEPVKEAEYFRSTQYRTDQAIKSGLDVADPKVRDSIAAQAYLDANRKVFMNPNFVTDAYQKSIQSLQHYDGKGAMAAKTAATIMKVVFPVVRVPTNYLMETTSYSPLGFAKAAPDMIKAIRKGVDSLSPEDADYVMRNLKKGLVGTAMMALGAGLSKNMGGFYTQGNYSTPDKMKPGEVRIAGVSVPRLFLHHPAIEAMQFGATLAHLHGDRKEPLASAFKDTSIALAEEQPFIGETIRNVHAMEKDRTAPAAGQFVGGLVTPPDLRRIAGILDPKTPTSTMMKLLQTVGAQSADPKYRPPQTFAQGFESGIPSFVPFVNRTNIPSKNLKPQKAAREPKAPRTAP